MIQGRICDRMQILGDRHCHLQLEAVAGGVVRNHDDRTGVCRLGDASDDEVVRRNHDASLFLAELDLRPAHIVSPEAAAGNAYFTAWESELRTNRRDVWFPVQLALSQQPFRDSHARSIRFIGSLRSSW